MLSLGFNENKWTAIGGCILVDCSKSSYFMQNFGPYSFLSLLPSPPPTMNLFYIFMKNTHIAWSWWFNVAVFLDFKRKKITFTGFVLVNCSMSSFITQFTSKHITAVPLCMCLVQEPMQDSRWGPRHQTWPMLGDRKT